MIPRIKNKNKKEDPKYKKPINKFATDNFLV